MTYSIYIDSAFFWSFFINFILLYISEYILANKIRIHSICFASMIISIVCTAEYVLFYGLPIIQNILYVFTYFLLLHIMHRLYNRNYCMILTYAVYILTSFFIAVSLMFISYNTKKGLFPAAVLYIMFIISSFYISLNHIKNLPSRNSLYHTVRICVQGKIFIAASYIDTGNSLRDMSGQPVIITDFDYASKILGGTYAALFKDYNELKDFDYAKANSISEISFRPIPYKTISSDFSIMPGFTADSIFFRKNGTIYRNITIAISSTRLRLPGNSKFLLNQNLIPRKENSND